MNPLSMLGNMPGQITNSLNPGFYGRNPGLGNDPMLNGLSLFSDQNPLSQAQQPQQLNLMPVLALLSQLEPDSPLLKAILEMLGIKQPESKQQNAAQQRQPQRSQRARRSSGSSGSSGSSRSSSSDEASSSTSKKTDKTDSTSETKKSESTDKADKTDSTKKTTSTTETKSKEKITTEEKAALDKGITKVLMDKDLTKEEYDKKFDVKINGAKSEADNLFKNEWSEEDVEVKENFDRYGSLRSKVESVNLDDGRTIQKISTSSGYESKVIKNADGEVVYKETTSDVRTNGVVVGKSRQEIRETFDKSTVIDVISDDGKTFMKKIENKFKDGSVQGTRNVGVKRGTLSNGSPKGEFVTWSSMDKVLVRDKDGKFVLKPAEKVRYNDDFLNGTGKYE